MFLHLFASGFSFAGHFRLFFGGCTNLKDCAREHLNCHMVVAEKVSEQIVMMTAPEMIVEAREQVLTMTAPAPGGLSEIHHSQGL
jgi:hypothetical protein